MELFRSRKKALVLLTVLSIFVLLFIMFSLSLVTNPSEQTIPASTPTAPSPTPLSGTPYPTSIYKNNPTYIESVEKINLEEKTTLEKEGAVANFKDSLPYTGTYFSASYNINTGDTTIVFTNRGLGDEELDRYLKTFDISDRTWIRNLIIQ